MRRMLFGMFLPVVGGLIIGWAIDRVAQAQAPAGDHTVIEASRPGGAAVAGPVGAGGPQSFEVASIKLNKSGEGFIRMQIQPGGRFTATNITLRELVRAAYQLQNFQVLGLPKWSESERYDILAKAEGELPQGPPTGAPGPLQLMMRSLLVERFNLKVHQEKQELPIYALVLARDDRKTGARLVASTTDCAAMVAARRGGGPPPQFVPGQRMPCGMRMGPGQLSAGAMTLTQFGNGIAQMVGRVVQDRTGLTGNFDIDLEWTPDRMPQGTPPPGVELPPVDPNGPSIFTAIQEQLGLKLESTRGPVDVLVVDSVEQPTPD